MLNSYTTNLLRRKIEFCRDRLAAMSQLEASVMACTLDGKCTFAMRTVYDQAQAMDSQQLAEALLNTPPAKWATINELQAPKVRFWLVFLVYLLMPVAG